MLNPKGVLLGLVWIEGGGVEGSRVELGENRLILSQFHSIVLPLLPPQCKQTIKS